MGRVYAIARVMSKGYKFFVESLDPYTPSSALKPEAIREGRVVSVRVWAPHTMPIAVALVHRVGKSVVATFSVKHLGGFDEPSKVWTLASVVVKMDLPIEKAVEVARRILLRAAEVARKPIELSRKIELFLKTLEDEIKKVPEAKIVEKWCALLTKESG